MVGIILYVLGTVWLCMQAWQIKKSDKKMQPVLTAYLLIFFLMGEQALFALLYHFVHIPIGLISLGISNVLLGGVIFYFKGKVGRQEYERLSVGDIFSVIFFTVITLWFCTYMWGWDLIMSFLSLDGKDVHCMLSETIAKTGNYENPQYFEALNSALWMQIFRVFIDGDEGYYKAHMLSQVVIQWLSAFGFYAVAKTYTENKKHDYLAGILTFFYAAGYPLFIAYFGFAYFGTIVNMIAAIFLIYRMMHKEEVEKWFSYGMLNLMLFSMFACYSFFIPFVFPPLFVALWFDEVKKEGKLFSLKMVRKEFQVFLLPCVIGMINSFSNLSQLGEGGGITNNGGCYVDIYSNFLRILPLAVVGMVVVWKKNKHDILGLQLVWSFVCLIGMIYFNHHGKISLYYVSKIYNILWLVFFVYIFVTLCELRDKVPTALGAIAVLIIASFLISKSPIPGMIADDNPEIYAPIHADYHGIYPDVYWYNQSMMEVVHNSTTAERKQRQNNQ